ncbi:MAG: class I SAM-dependent methyltransferase [Chloroflexaceae bacterium]|jgi:SAM-dependent methyltransferase|nr:class I SAM-dependent methyltransferase [Chloroflexaceae bacterium]
MYKHYASVYDGSGQVRFALLMAQYLEELLQRHPVGGRNVLELACGTGTLALLLADQGYHVIGVDQSAAMLAQARAKADNAVLSGSVAFFQADMRTLAGDRRPETGDADTQLAVGSWQYGEDAASFIVHHSSFDLVTCTYDSLNYMLTEDDLLACFRGIESALVPGGLFVGDMNTRYFLEQQWGACEVLEQSGYVQVSQSHFDADLAQTTMALTGFLGNDDEGYTRFDEVHAERAYPEPVVQALLAEAGLQPEAVYTCFTFEPPDEAAHRVMWVARKV